MTEPPLRACFIHQPGKQSWAIGMPQIGMQQIVKPIDIRHDLSLGMNRTNLRIIVKIEQVDDIEMHQILRQFITQRPVVVALAANEDGAETDVRKAANDLMHPARHAAGDIGIRSFKQQEHIHVIRFRQHGVRYG